MKELLFVISLFGSLLIPSAMYGQWYLFGAFAIYGVVFGGWELFAIKKTGKTVSQHFWEFSKNHPNKAWLILAGMAIGWVILIIHLGEKMIWKKKEE